MKFNALFLVFTFLISASCSYFPAPIAHRFLAAEAQSPIDVEELFTIKSSTHFQYSKGITDNLVTFGKDVGIEISFIQDSEMSSDLSYKIVPLVEDQRYKIKIFHSAGAMIDGDATAILNSFLRKINRPKYMSAYSIFELYYNANLGDFQSLHALAKLRLFSYGETPIELLVNNEFINREVDKVNYWKEINKTFRRQETKFNKQIKNQDQARREVMDVLDKVSYDKQFKTLVANNDRIGAAALIKQYLPWHEMPPFEKLFWENYLRIMVDPLPLEDRVLVFRGLDDEIVYAAEDAGRKLTREEAIKEQKVFQMSTMMSKNQGSWNRRLRSLTSMYEKFIATDKSKSSEYTKAARITTMFTNHAKDPIGSPFLSYSPDFNVANEFGYKRISANFIDPRMIYFNYTSKYTEFEFLLPLVSFPDDLAAIYDVNVFPEQKKNILQFLKETSISNLGNKYGAAKAAQVYEKIEINSKSFFKPVNDGQKGAIAVTTAGLPDKKFVSMFKKIQDLPTIQVKKIINENNDMTCLDLIQLFWK